LGEPAQAYVYAESEADELALRDWLASWYIANPPGYPESDDADPALDAIDALQEFLHDVIEARSRARWKP
jgi:hypothetical protein